MNNGLYNDLNVLDLLNILSYAAQLTNMQQDANLDKFVKQEMAAIKEMLNDIHQENQVIISQLKELKGYMTNGIN